MNRGYLRRWVLPIGATAVAATALWLASSLLDFRNSNTSDPLHGVLFLSNPDTGRYVLTSIAQTLAAVLGITMVVVLLVVQLAASRYSYSLIELYIEDRFNTAVLSAFVGSIIYSSWVANTIKPDFVPSLGTLAALILATGCFLSLIPYFRHVFGFLEPGAMVSKLERLSLEAQNAGGQPEAQKELVRRMGQLGRVATTSVSHMETDVALYAVAALERICLYHVSSVPAPNGASQLHPTEAEAINLLKTVYRLALGKARDVTYAAATTGRRIAEAAMVNGNQELSRTTLMLLNTMLRSGINEKDSLTIYHLLHQYRLLAETLVDRCDAMVLDVLFFFKYYAVTAQQAGIGYIIDTAAYDLNMLCQKASDCSPHLLPRMLGSFLDMEPFLEKRGQTAYIHSVRKMYAALAGHFLANGQHSLAEPFLGRLAAATASERERLLEELVLAPIEAFFWELTERKVNFDYIPQRERESLRPYLDGTAVH